MAKDLKITYETLFELLRIEKNREDLQKLDDSFFDDVLEYIKEKKMHFESKPVTQTLLFEKNEREQTRLELENTCKIIKDLYDRREKKILMTALNKAKTGITLVNSANMLHQEKQLFHVISQDLAEFRIGILNRLVCCQKPEMPTTLGNRDLSELPELDSVPEAGAEMTGGYGEEESADTHFRTNDQHSDGSSNNVGGSMSYPTDGSADTLGAYMSTEMKERMMTSAQTGEMSRQKEQKSTRDTSFLGTNQRIVRFLTSIDEIVGPDLQIYGPYETGDEITLPGDLARVLIEKNQAEGV